MIKISQVPKKNIVKLFILFLVLAIATERTYNYLTDDFRVVNITYEMPYHPEWEVASLLPEQQSQLDQILDQPFYYIGKGAQSYAFVSSDDQYVIKFVKFKHHRAERLSNVLLMIPFTKDYQLKRLAKHKRKLESAFDGYKMAYDLNKNESGLIALHLNQTKDLTQNHAQDQLKDLTQNHTQDQDREISKSKILTVTDKLGMTHEVDLDSVIYVVQKKAVVTGDVVDEYLKQGDLKAAQDKIGCVFDMFVREYNKGIYDRDYCVMKNTGFIGDQPVHFDMGKLTWDPGMREPIRQKKDLYAASLKIREWIKENHPTYADSFNKYLDINIESRFF